MARISKPPEVRRQEILDTAMELFAERGMRTPPWRTSPGGMGVVQGLCYRYFDSKRVLFREAMEQYVRECCAAGLPIIHDRSRTIRQRLDDMAALTLETEQNARYHAFYHRPENQSIHEELNWRTCAYLTPHVAEELEDACQRGELRLEHPALAASYLLHGQIGLLGEHAGAPGGAGGAPPALCRPDSGAGILNNASEARGRASEAKISIRMNKIQMNKIQ